MRARHAHSPQALHGRVERPVLLLAQRRHLLQQREVQAALGVVPPGFDDHHVDLDLCLAGLVWARGITVNVRCMIEAGPYMVHHRQRTQPTGNAPKPYNMLARQGDQPKRPDRRAGGRIDRLAIPSNTHTHKHMAAASPHETHETPSTRSAFPSCCAAAAAARLRFASLDLRVPISWPKQGSDVRCIYYWTDSTIHRSNRHTQERNEGRFYQSRGA